MLNICYCFAFFPSLFPSSFPFASLRWMNRGASRSEIFESESESHSVMSNSLRPQGLYTLWNSLAQNIGVGSLSLLQEIFPTQGLNSGLPHCRQILYQLSYKENPRTLEWVAYPFSSRSFQPRNQTWVEMQGLLHCRQILYQLNYKGSSEGKWKSLSPFWLFATPWIIQSMEFSRPEYWNG